MYETKKGKDIKLIKSRILKLEKQENAIIYKKENTLIKENYSPVKEKIVKKIPQKVLNTFQAAFEKGFHFLFENGVSIIDKSYNCDKKELNNKINTFILAQGITKKSLKGFDRQASKGLWGNKGIALTEGAVLGLFGIGLPDIPVFLGVLLRTVYEICISYGFNYESIEEKEYILYLLAIAASDEEDRIHYSKACDELGRSIDKGIINEKSSIHELIGEVSQKLSDRILLAKFIQGVPIVGISGAAVNYFLVNKAGKIAAVKYKKRFLYKTLNNI